MGTNNKGINSNFGFDMPEVELPVFPDRDFVITEYGAIGDGVHMNTIPIAKAIEDCAANGGGRIVIPAGVWLTGPITLRSNIDLHVEEGALVVFSKDFDDYPLILASFEGLNTIRCISPINGMNLENVAITGRGIFDGSGDAWRPVKRDKLTKSQWMELVNSGGVVDEDSMTWWPTKEALMGERLFKEYGGKILDVEAFKPYKVFARPTLLSLINCKKVLLDGPTFQNSPAWGLHPLMCKHITVRNINVRNPWYSQNGDGLDLESCKNAVIYNSTFDVGDDAICMKSGKDEDGRKRAVACENVKIFDCTVYHGHGGFVVGSEMSGDVRNIHVSDCTFIGTDVGLRFKSCRGRGGVVENIYIENIRMIDIPKEGIILTTYYEFGNNAPVQGILTATEETPEFRNIYFKDIICSNVNKGIHIDGLPELPINNISFENLCINSNVGVTCSEVKDIKFSKIRIKAKKAPTFSFYNSRDIELSNIESIEDGEVSIDIKGSKSCNIQK